MESALGRGPPYWLLSTPCLFLSTVSSGSARCYFWTLASGVGVVERASSLCGVTPAPQDAGQALRGPRGSLCLISSPPADFLLIWRETHFISPRISCKHDGWTPVDRAVVNQLETRAMSASHFVSCLPAATR